MDPLPRPAVTGLSSFLRRLRGAPARRRTAPSTLASPERRRVLRMFGGVAAGVCLAGLGPSGCRRAEEGAGKPGAKKPAGGDHAATRPPVTRLLLDDVPDGGRLRVLHGGRPVELRRVGGEVTARSLVCTHFACEVRWEAERQLYVCPCHDGLFAPDGRVVGGPPSRPLPELPVRLQGSEVVLEG